MKPTLVYMGSSSSRVKKGVPKKRKFKCFGPQHTPPSAKSGKIFDSIQSPTSGIVYYSRDRVKKTGYDVDGNHNLRSDISDLLESETYVSSTEEGKSNEETVDDGKLSVTSCMGDHITEKRTDRLFRTPRTSGTRYHYYIVNKKSEYNITDALSSKLDSKKEHEERRDEIWTNSMCKLIGKWMKKYVSKRFLDCDTEDIFHHIKRVTEDLGVKPSKIGITITFMYVDMYLTSGRTCLLKSDEDLISVFEIAVLLFTKYWQDVQHPYPFQVLYEIRGGKIAKDVFLLKERNFLKAVQYNLNVKSPVDIDSWCYRHKIPSVILSDKKQVNV